jgi:hypothetical protein
MDALSPAAESERSRVARHIARGGSAARARDVSHLDREQQLVRRLLLDELDRYVAACQFPLNHDYPDLTPYFVDAHGTRCAVAHLMEISGEGELVASVAGTRNNSRVRELADDPQLLAWLAAAGLTVDEAALIQPQYCHTQSECVCGGTFSYTGYPVPADGVLEAVKIDNATARVEATYGKTVVKVGDEIVVSAAGGPGARVLVPVEAGKAYTPTQGPAVPAVALRDDGTYVCNSMGAVAPPLTKAQFVGAVQSPDCGKTLAALDGRWSKRVDCGEYTVGCAAAPGAAAGPTSLALLLALVSALAWRARPRLPAATAERLPRALANRGDSSFESCRSGNRESPR